MGGAGFYNNYVFKKLGGSFNGYRSSHRLGRNQSLAEHDFLYCITCYGNVWFLKIREASKYPPSDITIFVVVIITIQICIPQTDESTNT